MAGNENPITPNDAPATTGQSVKGQRSEIDVYDSIMCALVPAIIAADTANDLKQEGESGFDAEHSIIGFDNRAQRVRLAHLYAVEILSQRRFLIARPDLLEDSQDWLRRIDAERKTQISYERAIEILRERKGRFVRQLVYEVWQPKYQAEMVSEQSFDNPDIEEFYKPWREMLAAGKDSRRFKFRIADSRTHQIVIEHEMDPDCIIFNALESEKKEKALSAPNIVTPNFKAAQQKSAAKR